MDPHTDVEDLNYNPEEPQKRFKADAMVMNALQTHTTMKRFAIRNASDPQMPNKDNNIKNAKLQAGEIYTKYGAFTSAASVIASWAIIDGIIN